MKERLDKETIQSKGVSPKLSMNKLLLSIVLLIVLLATGAGDVWAYEPEYNVTSSAQLLTIQRESVSPDFRVISLKKYLDKHKSPLAPYAHVFVREADKNGIDWRLVPAITGVESTFGKRIPYQSYNAYGWANGAAKFESWDQSITHVSKVLREKYYNKGAVTIPQIARRYAPPSTTWGGNVVFFMNQIDSVPAEFDL
jgi:hypothetical protein